MGGEEAVPGQFRQIHSQSFYTHTFILPSLTSSPLLTSAYSTPSIALTHSYTCNVPSGTLCSRILIRDLDTHRFEVLQVSYW